MMNLYLALATAAIFVFIICVVYIMAHLIYVKRLSKIFRGAVKNLHSELPESSGAEADNVAIISEAIGELKYEPIGRRWQLSYKDYISLGSGQAFVDFDEHFDTDAMLDEVLERRIAKEWSKWLLWSGTAAAAVVLIIGLASPGIQLADHLLTIILPAFIVALISALLALIYKLNFAHAVELCRKDYLRLMDRLHLCLPPVGKSSMLQNLFIVQQTQTANLQAQTQQMQNMLLDFATHTLVEQMGTVYSETISLHIKPSLQAMADTQNLLLNRLQQDQNEKLEKLFTLFASEAGNIMSAQLHEMSKQVDRSTEGMKEIADSLQTVATEVGSSLTQSKEANKQSGEIFIKSMAILDSINEADVKLTERFTQAASLIEVMVTSCGILGNNTRDACSATIELAEQAASIQKETGERYLSIQKTIEAQLVKSSAEMKIMQENLNSSVKEIVQAVGLQIQDMNSVLGDFTWKIKEVFAEQVENEARLQKEAAAFLASSFAGHITSIAETTESLIHKVQEASLETSRSFGREAEAVFELVSIQNREVAAEIQAQGRTNANLLSLTHKTLSDTSNAHINSFEKNSSKMIKAWNEIAAEHSAAMRTESRRLLEMLPSQMSESFGTFAKSMGETVRSSLTDSVEIIDKLGQRIEQLHGEFELYFSRAEGNTETMISDLRFAMEGAIGKFTELTKESLTNIREANSEAMEAFSAQTKDLMGAVELQTSTLSLYVKDMGIDMAELNNGLKSSVADFSDQLQKGVHYTFKEFDEGVSEIVKRMAELGSRVNESVEALPASIERLREK